MPDSAIEKFKSTPKLTVATTRIETRLLCRATDRLERSASDNSTASLFKKQPKMHFIAVCSQPFTASASASSDSRLYNNQVLFHYLLLRAIW